MKKDSVKIGIVGCGQRIRGVVQRLVEECDRVRVIGLCDNSEHSIRDAGKLFPDAQTYGTYEEMLANPEIEWIFIGSFNQLHSQHAAAALKAGKDVFCEKPIATNPEDCRALAEVVKSASGRFVMGFNLRYSPFYRRVRKLLDEGVVGDIISFEFNETLHPNHGAAMHGNWRRHKDVAGTFLLEKCCHDVDVMHWLTGQDVVRAASFGGLNFFKPEYEENIERLKPNADGVPFYMQGLKEGAYVGDSHGNVSPFTADKSVVDNQVAILELSGGTRASFHLCAHATIQERRFYICGTEGTIRADMLKGTVQWQRVGWDEALQSDDVIEEGDGHGGGDQVLTDELLACMFEGAPAAVGFEAGVRSAMTCFAIDQAMETGTVVNLQS